MLDWYLMISADVSRDEIFKCHVLLNEVSCLAILQFRQEISYMLGSKSL